MKASLPNTWAIISCILFLAYAGLDYYDFMVLKKQLTPNEAFVKGLAYTVWLIYLNNIKFQRKNHHEDINNKTCQKQSSSDL